MLTNALNILLAIFMVTLATRVHSSLIGCDPFPANRDSDKLFNRDFHSTCPNSLLVWTTQQEGLEVSSSMDKCESALVADHISSASVYFSALTYLFTTPYTIPVSSEHQYNFEYSLKWTQNQTFCVVDLTGSAIGASDVIPLNISDQNGLSNSPMEDLSAYATNQWYTRSFVINGTTLAGINSLRVGFSCAANVSSAPTLIQRAYVDNIEFHQIGSNYTQVLYSHRLNCTGCFEKPPQEPEFYCNNGTEYRGRWTVDGPFNITTAHWSQDVVINGDLFVDNLIMSSYPTMTVTGCIYPNTPDGLVNIHEDSDRWAYIQIDGEKCSFDRWNLTEGLILEYKNGIVRISTKYEPFCADCDDEGGRRFLSEDAVIILSVVFPVLATAGIILGLVFGIRKYRANRRARKISTPDRDPTQIELLVANK